MYATGLLSEGERKSMEPMAARACGEPEETHAMHERLIHFLAASPWPDAPVRNYAAIRCGSDAGTGADSDLVR